MDRRTAIKSCAALAVTGLSNAATAFSSFGAEGAGPRFKIGACDWNLGQTGKPQAIEVAARTGLDGIQASFGGPDMPFDLRKAENRRLYSEATKAHGPVIGSLAMGVLNSVPYKADPRTEAWVSDSIDVAKEMGQTIVLLAFFGKNDLKGDAEGTAETIRRLKKVAPKAEKAGVVLGLETWLNAEEHMRIIDSVGSPAIKVYYDLGNSLHKGYDIYSEIRQLGLENICEVHAKDYAGRLFGQGNVDFWEVRRALDDIGYSGWVHIEGQTPFGLIDSYRHDLQFLRGVLS